MSKKYEKLYAEHRHALGEPFAEVVDYFEALNVPMRVLDLGAGQGRDALFIARLGHEVHAVDLSPTGLAQLAKDGAGLKLSTEVADLRDYAPDGDFDVILIDRTLHMLGVDAGVGVLERVLPALSAGGEIYILDEKKDIPSYASFLRASGFEMSLEKPSQIRAKRL